MNLPRLLLLGAGGHARACIDVIEAQAKYQVGGLIAAPAEIGSTHCGSAVIGTDDDLPGLRQSYALAFVGIGQIKSAQARMRAFHRLLELGFSLPAIISPHAYVSPYASIGMGTIVMHGAIVNAGARVGSNCIINSRALIEHDAVVGNHCHISTGAILNGGASVGDESFIGSGSVVREGIVIAPQSVVGMGSMVKKPL